MLSQYNLPLSFQFYDPIVHLINERVSSERKQFFNIKTEFNISKTIDKQLGQKLLKKLGVTSDDQKLIFQYTSINPKEDHQINHLTSNHTKMLQRSNYLSIEIDPDIKHIQSTTKEDENKDLDIEEKELFLKYCKKEDVNNKRQKFLVFKQKYLVKLEHIKSQGQKQQQFAQIYNWIENNVHLFEQKDKEGYCKLQETLHKTFGISQKGLEKQNKISKFSQYKERNRLIETLQTIAVKLINDRRLRLRNKIIEEIRYKCKPNNNYNSKNLYLESKIETVTQFFAPSAVHIHDHEHDESHHHAGPCQGEIMNNRDFMMYLRKELIKIDRYKEEKKKQGQKNSKNRDLLRRGTADIQALQKDVQNAYKHSEANCPVKKFKNT